MQRPLRQCNAGGCKELTRGAFCAKHAKDKEQRIAERAKRYDKQRGSAHSRGYDARWRREREIYLSNNPLCVECKSRGEYRQATVVDHIKPHRGDKELFWDRNNWQPLCETHHNAKTARGL